MNETKELAKRCCDLDYNGLPDDVIDRAKYLLLDYLGVAARGSAADSSRPVQRLVAGLDSPGKGLHDAPVIGTSLRVGPTHAALANGTAAHSLELDDVVNEASLHPGVVIMSAALAVAESEGCTGREMLAAIVAGYEATIRLGISLDPAAHYARGFHPTGTCGTMGAAVTACKILKPHPDAMTNALGIAGSQAAGSMEFLSDGALTKRLHAGWAAHSGITAALLAREGFTGPGTILEGESGFLHSYSAGSDPDKIMENWGSSYGVMRTSIKPHACCRYKQGPIDGILELMAKNGIEADSVESVTLGVLRTGFPIVCRPEEAKYDPKSVVDAQFSMPFGGAVAILFGEATLAQYTEENAKAPRVREMMKRVRCVEDPELEKEFPRKWPASVVIKTKQGTEHSIWVAYPKGDPENPLSWDELIDKFRNLTRTVFSGARQDAIIERVRSLEREKDLRVLSEDLLLDRC